MRNKILIPYNTKKGIALDTTSSLWSSVLENFVKQWCSSAIVVVVKNMIVLVTMRMAKMRCMNIASTLMIQGKVFVIH